MGKTLRKVLIIVLCIMVAITCIPIEAETKKLYNYLAQKVRFSK